MIQIGEGSLYPALYRMELKGWIKAEWGVTENNRRAKYYNHWLFGVGRLKPGVTREQAQAALVPIPRQQAETFPDINRNRIVTLTAVNDGDPTQRGQQVSVAGALPFRPDFAIDEGVLGFTIVLSMLTGVFFGLAPAWRAARFDLAPALKDGASAAGERTRRFNMRSALVVTIVGVVRDSKYLTLGEALEPCVYLPLGQNHETGITLHVRSSSPPANLVASVRQAVQSLDKNLPMTNVRPLDELLGVSLNAPSLGALLIGVCGLSVDHTTIYRWVQVNCKLFSKLLRGALALLIPSSYTPRFSQK